MLINSIFKLIFMCLSALPICSKNHSRLKCHDDFTDTTTGLVNWEYKDLSYAISKDLVCLKNKNQILIRMCDTNTGLWIPESVDCKMKINKNTYCPDELFELRWLRKVPLCIKISTTLQAYNEQFCYGSNIIMPIDLTSSEISKVTQFLITKKIKDYWLPVKRNNAFMPFEVRLPGKSWRKVVNKNLIQVKNNSDEHCLKHIVNKQSTNNSKNVIVSVECNTLLSTVCIFKSQLISIVGCPNGFGALIYRPNECYGIDWKKNNYDHVSAKEYFEKRNWLRMIVAIQSKYKNQNFFKIDYFLDNFGEKYYILMNPYERVKVVSKDIFWIPALSKLIIKSTNSVEMVLQSNENIKTLTLLVYNRNYLWVNKETDIGVKCFTYSKLGFLKNAKVNLIWENKEKTYSVIQVKLVSSFRSEYWCEGHTIFDFQKVSTRRIIAVKNNLGYGFVIRWNVSCIHHVCNSLSDGSQAIIKKLRSLKNSKRKNGIFNDLIVHNVRIMNRERASNVFIVNWIHVTTSLKISSVNNSVGEMTENDKSEQINTVALKRMKNILKKLVLDISKNTTSVIRSTDYCFPQRFLLINDKQNQWNIARRGDLGTTKRLCIQKNGMPYTRLCQGDFLHGAYWKDLITPVFCESTPNSTNILYKLKKSSILKSSPEKVLRKAKNIITENINDLIPADIFFVSNIIQNTLKTISSNVLLQETYKLTNIWRNLFLDLIDIYNLIISIDLQVIKMSTKLNTTNKLLESFEHAFDTISTMSLLNKNDFGEALGSESENEFIDYEDIGVSVQISQNILYFSINPSLANVSGIALFLNNKTGETHQKLKGLFINEHYRFLQSNHDINDLVKEPNLQLSVYLPTDLLINLKALSDLLASSTNRSDPNIVIKVYSTDKLFQQTTGLKTLLSRIVSVSLPGYGSILPLHFPLIIRRMFSYELNKSGSCQYWKYGDWASDGIITLNHSDTREGIVLCFVSHLAPYAYLLEHNIFTEKGTEINEKTLCEDITDVTIIACCLLTLMGICSSFVISRSLKH
uniref:Uncharacterized protein LOC108038998 n=1 Tax=Drosophila rhopaloa TaxID=1041015 RepID=A0A6P4EDG8_DRORH